MNPESPTTPSRDLPVEIFPDADALSRRGAMLVIEALRHTPSLLLCTATGASPTGLYAGLTDHCRAEPDLFRVLRIVELDEWGGLHADAPGSCGASLRRHVLDPLAISEDRYLGFRGDAPDSEAECRRVAERLDAWGPIGVAVLGLGLNGHLGLNEPSDVLRPHAHVATLTPETLRHPMLGGAPLPRPYGLTLGMSDLLQAKRLLLLVSGAHKRDALRRLLSSGITTYFPASLLKLHPNARILCDRDAAP